MIRKDRPPRLPDIVKVPEMAERLGVGLNQAYELLATGKIKGAFRLGREWLIPRPKFERQIAGEE